MVSNNLADMLDNAFDVLVCRMVQVVVVVVVVPLAARIGMFVAVVLDHHPLLVHHYQNFQRLMLIVAVVIVKVDQNQLVMVLICPVDLVVVVNVQKLRVLLVDNSLKRNRKKSN